MLSHRKWVSHGKLLRAVSQPSCPSSVGSSARLPVLQGQNDFCFAHSFKSTPASPRGGVSPGSLPGRVSLGNAGSRPPAPVIEGELRSIVFKNQLKNESNLQGKVLLS